MCSYARNFRYVFCESKCKVRAIARAKLTRARAPRQENLFIRYSIFPASILIPKGCVSKTLLILIPRGCVYFLAEKIHPYRGGHVLFLPKLLHGG